MLLLDDERFSTLIKIHSGGGCCSCTGSVPAPPSSEYPEDEDVLAEEELVKGRPPAQADDRHVAVQVRGLVKTFPGVSQVGCCKCKKTAAYHAVKVRLVV